ncbi:dynein regulatory complex subunit 2 [Heliangelus exortis]|uniref:dynein regulatory complex subunit 2 n=1 Tax=Heliangelus exortis TaxID=472823 RepID=UPI003A8F34FC
MEGKRASGPAAGEQELRALAEEEAAKRKEEMLTRFLKDKVAKEEGSSTLNLHKLDTQWRAMLRAAKDAELRRDVEVLMQTFSRVLDCKDSAIESLVTELEEVEEQHSRALRSHLQNLQRLLRFQRRRLSCLEENYNAQLRALSLEFEDERRTILEHQEKERSSLRELAMAAEQIYARSQQEDSLNFQSARDDIKNKSLLEKQYTRLELGEKVEKLWEKFQEAMQSYGEATEHLKIAFKALKQKDRKNAKEIELQAKKLQKLQDLVAATKGQMAAQLRESEEQNRRMRVKKEKALRKLQELKAEMSQARAKARGNLGTLVMQSEGALKTLEKVVEKAQRILRLAEMCRKLETEQEKVLPFYPSSLAEGEQEEAQRILHRTPEEPLARVVRDYAGLERFWQRFNKAKLEEKALERERAELNRRNRRLRDLLGQYLAGICVTQEVLDKPNPLLSIRHKRWNPEDVSRAGGDAVQGQQGDKHPPSLFGGEGGLEPARTGGTG